MSSLHEMYVRAVIKERIERAERQRRQRRPH